MSADLSQVPVISAGNTDICQDLAVLSPPEWGPPELAEYIRAQIARTSGPQPWSDKDDAIIEDFAGRHGMSDAILIARVAFEDHDGMWMGAPVRAARFAPSSDEIFARRILASG